MENFVISLNVVLPLFLLMALGYGLKFTNLFDEKSLRVMNNAVFKIFLPLMLFDNIYNTDVGSAINGKLIAYGFVSVIIIFTLCFIFIPMWEKDNRKKGVLIQAIFRSNFVVFGIPLIESMYGKEGVGAGAILIATIIPLFNIMAVTSLSVFVGKGIDYKKIVKNIVTNPLIIASLVGLTFVFAGIKLPYVFEKSVSDLGGVATPLALVVLGASFNFKTAAKDAKQIFVGVFGRLILVPIIFVPLGAYLGFRGADLMALIAMFASPTAISSFTMAQSMGSDGDLAASLLVFGAIFSVLTIFLFTYGSISMGWL